MSTKIKACVIGHPIKHSKSPLIHNYWLKAYGLKGKYDSLDIAPEKLKQGVEKLIKKGYSGFNVTVPHKESIMELCDEIDTNAQAIGAVNTVIIKEDGTLKGMNTDGFGFIQNVWDTVPEFEPEGKTALVLGAGGAARAIVSGLIGEEIGQIIIMNRTRERADKIVQDLGFMSDLIKVMDWQERHKAIALADILINATTLGMQSSPPLALDLGYLPQKTIVCDIVYTPLQTQLLKDALARGNKTVTGIGMLIHQARPAFKVWSGVLPDVTDKLRGLVLK